METAAPEGMNAQQIGLCSTRLNKRGLVLRPAEPWPTPVNGAGLLDALVETTNKYVVCPRHGAETLAFRYGGGRGGSCVLGIIPGCRGSGDLQVGNLRNSRFGNLLRYFQRDTRVDKCTMRVYDEGSRRQLQVSSRIDYGDSVRCAQNGASRCANASGGAPDGKITFVKLLPTLRDREYQRRIR
jgi:hypothetical protein